MDNKKVKIYNLAIELTKRCNLDCAHCLKGESKKVDIDQKTIDDIFKQVDTVGRLFFTGGEPTLAPESLQHVINAIKKYNVKIMEWGMDTNGTTYSSKFYNSLVELEKICRNSTGSNEMHGTIMISTDTYHRESIKNAGLLTRSKYNRSIKETEKLPWFMGYRDVPDELFNEGRATKIYDKKKIKFRPLRYSLLEKEDSNIIGIAVFINANGDITQCDCSHERQTSDFYGGNVSKSSILDIVKNSKDIVYFKSEEEFYKDIDEQYDSYQNAASFEEVHER